MVGVITTSLLVSGGTDDIHSMRNGGLPASSPLAFLNIMSLICVSLWKTIKICSGEIEVSVGHFDIDILDPFAFDPYKDVWRLRSKILRHMVGFFTNIFIAPFKMTRILKR